MIIKQFGHSNIVLASSLTKDQRVSLAKNGTLHIDGVIVRRYVDSNNRERYTARLAPGYSWTK